MDSRVDQYINPLPAWQRDICQLVRKLVLVADPEVTETIKRTDRPYFVLDGNICALQATMDHVNIFIYDPIAPDPTGIVNQGSVNATARSIQVYKDYDFNESAFVDLVKAVIANNRSGGWRKLQKTKR